MGGRLLRSGSFKPMVKKKNNSMVRYWHKKRHTGISLVVLQGGLQASWEGRGEGRGKGVIADQGTKDSRCSVPKRYNSVAFNVKGFPSSRVTICLQCKRPRSDPCGEAPCRREWRPTPVFLPGEFHGERSLVGYSPWGLEELNRTE